MNHKQTKKLLLVIYIFVFLAVFVLTCLTPMLADDFSYSFSFSNGERIRNLGDVFSSLKAHRIKMNGRMISHGLTMLFLLMPKMVFNVANAMNATLLLFLITRFLKQTNEYEATWRDLTFTILSALLLWVFMPVFGQVFLWMDGSLNYTWAMTAILAFLLPFYREYTMGEEKQHKRISVILFYLLSFVAGAFSENASYAGIFMAFCFLTFIYNKRKTVPLYLIVAFVFSCFGFLYMMTAPAESGRAAQSDLIGIAKNIQRSVEAPQKTLLPLYCLFAVLMTVAIIKKQNKKTIAAAAIFFVGSMVSVAVFIFAVYFPWRSLCATTVFLILADLTLLGELKLNGQEKLIIPALTAGLSIFCAFSFVLAVGDIGVLYMESRQREDVIVAGIKQELDPIMVHQYSSNTKYAASYLLPDLYEDPGEWPNYDVAKYYGAPAIVGLPPVEEFGNG